MGTRVNESADPYAACCATSDNRWSYGISGPGEAFFSTIFPFGVEQILIRVPPVAASRWTSASRSPKRTDDTSQGLQNTTIPGRCYGRGWL